MARLPTQRPLTKTCVCSNCSASRASLCTWYTVSSCRMSVLKPKIMRFRLSRILFSILRYARHSCRNRSGRMKLLSKRVLSLTHLPVKINLERLLLLSAQIIYSSSYAGQLFRSLLAPPDALWHRHDPCERDCHALMADRPAYTGPGKDVAL